MRVLLASVRPSGLSTPGPRAANAPRPTITPEFGSLVFNDEVQSARLPETGYRALRRDDHAEGRA